MTPRMTRARASIAWTAIVATAACTSIPVLPADLRAELRSRQQTTGLAIAIGLNGAVEVFSFDDPAKMSVIQLGGKRYDYLQVVAFGKRFFAVQGRDSFVVDDQGRPERTLEEISSQTAALSPDGSQLAVVENEFKWLTIVQLETGERITVWDRAIHPTWSPDSKKLLYEKVSPNEDIDRVYVPSDERMLRIFDVTSRTSTDFTRGTYPSWSPDGRWIAHQADGHLVLTDASSRTTVRRLADADRMLMIAKWSPDSEYLLLAGRAPASIWSLDQCLERTDLIVYRLKDGKSGSVFHVCKAFPFSLFEWIENPKLLARPR